VTVIALGSVVAGRGVCSGCNLYGGFLFSGVFGYRFKAITTYGEGKLLLGKAV